jgi:hypothetical protein
MISNLKKHYESPAMQVVEMQLQTSLCKASNYKLNWAYDYNMNQLTGPNYWGWGRTGYGNVNEF